MTLPFFALTIPKAHPFVNDFGMASNYSATETGAATSVILTVNRAGTWAITFGSGDTPAGTPTSGSWAASPFSTVGDIFEVKFTPSNQVGSPTITNGASSYTALTANRSIEVSKSGADASADILVEIREVNIAAPLLSESSNFAANGSP